MWTNDKAVSGMYPKSFNVYNFSTQKLKTRMIACDVKSRGVVHGRSWVKSLPVVRILQTLCNTLSRKRQNIFVLS